MFKEIKDVAKKIIKSRLFALSVIMVLLFAILLQRVFTLQIVHGQEYADKYTLLIEKEQTTTGTRGNIFDRNGKLLAYNELSYTVTIEDSGTNYSNSHEKNASLNNEIYELIKIIEENGDSIVSDFSIRLNEQGAYEFTVSGTSLQRFRADVYGYSKIEDMSKNEHKLGYEESEATPEQVVDFLRSEFEIRLAGTDTLSERDERYGQQLFSAGDLLKILSIRYAMNQNNYRKYITTDVATDVSEKTVAAIRENSPRLEGVDIKEDTVRVYADSVYFSNIVGYTGKISQEEYDELSKENEDYTLTDIVGKSGIEQEMETVLQGSKGYESFFVDNVGRVVEMKEYEEAEAGKDVYLSIDADLQKAVYHLLEQEIAGIVYSKIRNIKEYSGSSASDIVIPIDDVYFALINNNVIDIDAFAAEDAIGLEKTVYDAFLSRRDAVLSEINGQLSSGSAAAFEELGEDMQDYMTCVVTLLQDNKILIKDAIDTKDEVYRDWRDRTISLGEYLQHAIAMEWIDITGFETDSKYSDSLEMYEALLAYIQEALTGSRDFAKLVYKYMIRDEAISGSQICRILFEQGLLAYNEEDYNSLASGAEDPYDFMREKIKNLEITPAQLALDPCSGSSVIINPQTGEVLACVSYPGYDSNRLANNMDSKYFNNLMNDLTSPMYNKATQEKTAPGSTYKPVIAAAALTEGYITPTEEIEDKGVFELVEDGPKCWLWPNGTHGSINVSEAIRDSCNYFFYTLGYNMSLDENGAYSEKKGIDTITKYAEMFGLGENTGIEVPENEPQISDKLPIPTAIGQGTNNYTTSELARYTAAIASSGNVYQLTLLDKVTDSDGTLIEDHGPEIKSTMEPIADSTWEAIQSGMRMVITDGSHSEMFDDFPADIPVAGKTGTAQQITTRPNHALFIGYAPADNPTLAMATRIAYGYTSGNAEEVSKKIMEYYFGVKDSSELITGQAADVGNSANSFTD